MAEEEEEEEEEEEDDDDYEVPTTTSRKRGCAKGGRKAAGKKKKKGRQNSPKKVRKFQKTSNIDVTAANPQNGWTALHYAVAPTSLGGYQNAKAIQLLLDSGGDPSVRDHQGRSPLDLACQMGQWDVANILWAAKPRASVVSYGELVPQLFRHMAVPDFEKDAARFLELEGEKRKEEREKAAAEQKKQMLRPHPLSDYSKTGELVTCPETNQICSVLLNKVDVDYGMYGFYNFYRLELIKRTGTDLYIVFTNWGRIGDQGQYQRTPFGKLEEAMKEFKSIFKQKTANEWTQILNFVEKPKKYRLVSRGGEDSLKEPLDTTEVEIKLEPATGVTSQLETELKETIMDVANVKQLQQKTRALGISNVTYGLPLGRLTRETILKGKEVLDEILLNIRDLEATREERQKQGQPRNTEKCLRIMSDIAGLSNDFYQLIPMQGFSRCQLDVIDEQSTWTQYNNFLNNLLDMDIAGQLVHAAALNRTTVHPADYIHQSLNFNTFRLLEPSSDMAQAILQNIWSSSPETKVRAVFELGHQDQDVVGVLKPQDSRNRMMLWHGSGAENVLSILKLGLLAAPPQAVHTGHLFGQVGHVSWSFICNILYVGAMPSSTGLPFLFSFRFYALVEPGTLYVP